METSEKGLGDRLYNDAASLGRLRALIGLVVGSIIAVVIFMVGVSKMMSTNKHSAGIQAKITQLTGCSNTSPKTPVYQCTVALTYIVNGVTYNVPSFKASSAAPLVVNDPIMIYYDPANPTDISSDSLDGDKKLGMILMGVAFLIVGMAYFFWWLSKRYAFFAAAEGVGLAGQALRMF
jgi:hypothetical protein